MATPNDPQDLQRMAKELKEASDELLARSKELTEKIDLLLKQAQEREQKRASEKPPS